jgi:molybdopterin-biosynthesis enzyme MoeA-like protein
MLLDDLEAIVEAIDGSVRRDAGIVITTGGLGPTPDDLTVEAVAKLVGTRLILHEPTLADFMRRRNLTSRDQLTPGMMKMATVPEGAEVCQNPAGWAPCISLKKEASTLFILPGPPKEMEALFTRYVAPFISSAYQTKSAALRVVVNMFESEVSPLLQEVMKRYPQTYLKAYVAMRHSPEQGLPVDIVASGDDAASAQHKLSAAVDYLGQLVAEKGKVMEYYEG